jgi:hypothetical protein
VLPVVEAGIADPASEAATPPESRIDDEVSVVELESVSAIVATTPFAMLLELMPQTTHVETPDVLLQVIDFPDAVATAPAATLNELTSFVA